MMKLKLKVFSEYAYKIKVVIYSEKALVFLI